MAPPGDYRIIIYRDEDIVGARNITLYGDQKYTIITNHQPQYPTFILTAGMFFVFLSVIIFFIKKKYAALYLFIPLILISISFVLPWWGIHGSTGNLDTSTNLYLLPVKLITLTSTVDTISGEPSYLPDEFHLGVTLILLAAFAGSTLLLIHFLLRNRVRTSLFRILHPLGLIGIVGSLIGFLVAYNAVCRVSVGSLVGNGYLDAVSYTHLRAHET